MKTQETGQQEVPKFVLTPEHFAFFHEAILKIGYHEIKIYDSRKTFIRLALSAPRKIVGREKSYYCTYNGYTSIIHTTFLEKENMWRVSGTDIAWNLIAHGDKPSYFARPFQRTKGLIIKLLRYAYISKWKIEHRPLCKECKAYMVIFRKKGTRSYYWACFNTTRHAGNTPQYLPWDHELPPEDVEFLNIRREYTQRYNKKNKKEGKTPTPAAVIRKPWIEGNPQNRI